MYSTHNEGKSVVPERFIRTLKNNIWKYTTSIPKNVYFHKLDNILNTYNNTYLSTIKMKPANVKNNKYINFNKKNNKEGPKLKVGEHLRISKCKNILLKSTLQIGLKKFLLLKNVKNTVPWTHVINDFNSEEIVETFYEKELLKTNQEEFRIEKIIKWKGDNLHVKWKGYDNSFNS